jgi:transketolase
MRVEFAAAMTELAGRRPKAVFLTGDLGYMALEGVRDAFGSRFINAGVAEQNMVSVAAGLAREGFQPWLYSIAPFAALRPFEQIRNDACLHNLPVKIVGNGGGYGYGIMGATHHTNEDIGVLRALPNMRVYVPLVGTDVAECIAMMSDDPAPNYLRLNLAPKPPVPLEPFTPWRRMKEGSSAVVITTGPVAWNLFKPECASILDRLEVWNVGVFPAPELPETLMSRIRHVRRVVTMEEHYAQAGLGETIAAQLLERRAGDIMFARVYSVGYPSGRYGSQTWHQEESGLAGDPLRKRLEGVLNG